MRTVRAILAVVIVALVVYAAYAAVISTNNVTYRLNVTKLSLSLTTSPPSTMLAGGADTEFFRLSTSVAVTGSVSVTVVNSTSSANEFQQAETFHVYINGTNYTPPSPPPGNNFSHQFGPYSVTSPGTVFNCTIIAGSAGTFDVIANFVT